MQKIRANRGTESWKQWQMNYVVDLGEQRSLITDEDRKGSRDQEFKNSK